MMLQFLIAYSSMALLQATAGTETQAELFEMRVRPVLAANCYSCHGEARMGGLRLDSRAELMKGGASGPAIVAGKSEQSLLMRAVRRTHERFKMPPQQALKPEEIAGLAAWIDGGAFWPEGATVKAERSFWSLQPVRKPEPPGFVTPPGFQPRLTGSSSRGWKPLASTRMGAPTAAR